MQAPRERLDSWKAIADYLRRDERTVRRWEKSLGLPVRRVPGGRGHSVFAYVSEIDAWLRSHPPIENGAGSPVRPRPGEAPLEPPVPSGPPAPSGASASDEAPPVRLEAGRWMLVAGTALALVVFLGAVWTRMPGAARRPFTVTVSTAGVTALDASGAERWRYPFPEDERTMLPEKTLASVLTGPGPGVLVATSTRERLSDRVVESGQLLALSPAGRLDRAFQFDDRLTFGGVAFGAPWAITDVRTDVRDGARVVAVAAHHYQWWPGLVTVLDEDWRRRGTFVNAGWVETIDWLADGRLLAAGFSNARDGGMVAVLDPDAIAGQSPEADGSAYRCGDCEAGAPLRYVVLPRSELNRVTAARFNRAIVQVMADRVVVRTSEVSLDNDEVADALYEFSPAMELRRASFSDRYWDVHDALEARGVLDHGRAACRDRDGPRAVEIWEPATGWREVVPGREP